MSFQEVFANNDALILSITCLAFMLTTIALMFSVRSKNIKLTELKVLHEHESQEVEAAIQEKSKLLADLNEKKQALEIESSAIRERASRIPELEKDGDDLRQALVAEQRTNEALTTRIQEQTKAMNEKLALLEDAKVQMKESFENLANQILEEKGQKFDKETNEKLVGLLNPLKEQIGTFQKTVSDTHIEDTKERSMLREQLNNLKTLNQQLSEDATGLTRALKGDSKARGQWGELSLSRLLEASGLKKGEHYDFNMEVSKKSEDGRTYRPDAIINLPEDRQVVIDSKVSLNAYTEYCESETDADKSATMKRHVAAMRTHIAGLGGKQYERLEGVNSLDMVLMFVPIEAAFIDAVNHDDSLYDAALKKNIVIVCPATLLATLKTIGTMWRVEDRNRNADEIARQAGSMYDKFCLFIDSLKDVGVHLEKATVSHTTAMKRLADGNGNIIGKIENLKKLGADATKQLPEDLLLEAND